MDTLYQFLTICQGGDQSEFISVFDIAAGRHTASDTSDFDFIGLQLLFQIESGQVAFGRGVGSQNDFLDAVIFHSIQKFVDTEVLTVVTFAAFEQTSQDVIEPLIRAGAFDGDDIERFFDKTERVLDTFGISADKTELSLGDVETTGTALQMVERLKAFREALEFFFILFEEVKYNAFGHFGTDRGKAGKMRDQGLKNFGVMHI